MDIKSNLTQNLITYRKHMGLTQAELAEKLNYSDKAVSKWERGESVPDLFVMKEIADIFGVTIDTLIADPKPERVKLSLKNISKKRTIIGACSIGIVWLVAVVAYAFMGIIYPPLTENAWIVFIVAIPITFIVLLVFTSIWGKNLLNAVFTSLLVWSLILTIFLILQIATAKTPNNYWLLFLIGIPLQVLTVLWFTFKKIK